MTLSSSIEKTPLYSLHQELGGKMVPFAGYELPVQYRSGIIAEHKHTREKASLFDVSHMGQAWLEIANLGQGEQSHRDVAKVFETLVPGEIQALKRGATRYTFLLSEDGGILDDLMVTRPFDQARQGSLYLVVNGATKAADFAHIERNIGSQARLVAMDDRALLALQGPGAADVMSELAPDATGLRFMESRKLDVAGFLCWVSRSGYTGEDGFEISVECPHADALARALLSDKKVEPAGLGARDSLRLEAGLCLYGHDLTPAINPIEAGLGWAIGKRRREQGGFPGAQRILELMSQGAPCRRVGLVPEGRVVAREGTEILSASGEDIGRVTSGGFGPTVSHPIALGLIDIEADTDNLVAEVRGREIPLKIAKLPFVPHNYKR